jgi:hypothetical protein
MLVNSTVELMTLSASSSPSLMAFCFSHFIIVVLLLGSRGCAPDLNGAGDQHVPEGSEADTPDDDAAAAQIQGIKLSSGGQDEPVVVIVTANGDRGSAPKVHCRVEECSVEAGVVGAAVQRTQAREESSRREDLSIAADASSSEEKCGDEEEEEDDELMMRAEEFIERMNRVWRTESARVG